MTLSRLISAIGAERLREITEDPEARSWMTGYTAKNTAGCEDVGRFFGRYFGMTSAEYGILATYTLKMTRDTSLYSSLKTMSAICEYVDLSFFDGGIRRRPHRRVD